MAAFRKVDWHKLADACEKPEWKTDPRFQNSAGLEDNKNDRLAMTQEALLERTTEEWIERLDRFDVPHAPVLTRSEMKNHPQVQANKIIIELDHPHAGPLRQTRSPVTFDGTPTEQRFGGALLGEHTSEVLSEAGYCEDDIKRFIADELVVQS